MCPKRFPIEALIVPMIVLRSGVPTGFFFEFKKTANHRPRPFPISEWRETPMLVILTPQETSFVKRDAQLSLVCSRPPCCDKKARGKGYCLSSKRELGKRRLNNSLVVPFSLSPVKVTKQSLNIHGKAIPYFFRQSPLCFQALLSS